MSSVFALFSVAGFVCACIVMALIAGGPLLYRVLNRDAVSRQECRRAAWFFAGGTIYLTIGNSVVAAQERGAISFAACGIVMMVVFAIAVGSHQLLDRWYPEEKKS